METLLKWLNKPKADDKSLLARFFHADRALTAVASELDSFDGRAEPDRCSRLVSRLRQGQDKVLAITNLIIEELLGDERDQRAFRAKFPEEVLQENLGGQLWFGAECLAAGSSIMNREQESKEMRPLAEAVTRSLNNVRYLLRDQCLRNNVPNSERLNLDKNDAATEQLYESLKRFDRLFAEFEWRYVSAMVQVKSKEEYEMQELICVLCSETLQRALKLGLLEQEKVDSFDPALMFSIPRLAIVSGLVIYPDGPLNMDMPAEQLSEMFRPFRSILIKVREYLRNLNETELYYLERLLCTNEEISLKDTLNTKDSNSDVAEYNNNIKSSKYSESSLMDNEENKSSLKTATTASKLQHKSSNASFKTKPRRADSPSPAPSTTSSSSDECSPYNTPESSTPSSPRSSHSLASTTSAANDDDGGGTTSPDSWMEDDEEDASDKDDDDNEENLENVQFLAARDEDDHYADDDDSDINNEDQVNDNMKHNLEQNIEDDDEDDDEEDDVEHSGDIYALHSMVEQIINLEMALPDCTTGYLISNTTLGNLLQPQEVPLTDNFIVSDSDLCTNEDTNDNDLDIELPSTSARALNTTTRLQQQLQKENPQDDLHLKNEQDNKDNNNSATTTHASISLQDPDEISVSQQSSINNVSSTTATTTTTTSSSTRRRRYSDQHSYTQSQLQSQSHSQSPQNCCNKDHTRSQRHHHRHHHHHHHHHHNHHHTHHVHSMMSNRTASGQHNQSHHRHRAHHNHHHRRPHRHGGDNGSENHTTTTTQCEDCTGAIDMVASKEDHTMENSKATSSIGVLDIETPSSSSSILEDNKTAVLRSSGKMKFKHTENLLHRLFVCIAGVADQLQTNFAFDLRQILRSVFLINMSAAQEELDIPEKAKDNELFEFRASENDVIQESAGSSQSIYSAEEVNPEGDNQSNSSNSSNSSSSSSCGNENNRAYRHSTGTTTITTTSANTAAFNDDTNQRQQIERSRSLDNQVCDTINDAQQQQQQQPQRLQHNQHIFRNRYHSTGSSNTPSISSSENSSPICERSSNTNSTTTTTTTTNRRVSESNANTVQQHQRQQQEQQQQHQINSSSPVLLSPPAWIPDQKAPRCMSCNTPFTAFRRRHHCRNCGGVFCGVCSNTSAPLPKYGLTKAVRVCRACYVHELSSSTMTTATVTPAALHNTQQQQQQQQQHHHNNHHLGTGVNTTITTNNHNIEPRLRRPVTTTRAID